MLLLVMVHDDNSAKLQIYITLNYNSAVIPIVFVLIIDRSESHLLGNLQLLHT